ncbi:hypothetical protein [Streptomyces althioticus]|uniref:hypothetical protein n=1 Tax=Streptomyces althioticus TaxID=83380 RepID=UPI0033EEDFA4
MEQRIGSSSSKPLEGAGFDPAFIPGLTAPATGREEEAKDTKDAPGTDGEDGAVDDTVTEAAPDEAEETGESEDSPAAEAEKTEHDDEPEPAPAGPAFEASDRRAALVADHRGVRLKLDEQECEFRWDEIGAVETETARFGKRFTVTVHTPDRRWYPIEIEADSRRRFAEWDAALDEVLDAYFEDGAEAPEAKDSKSEAEDDPSGEKDETGAAGRA